MKRDPDRLNLRDAFRPMPDAVRDALMGAARSVKEEEPMKRATCRTLLLAACILMVTMSVVLAAGSIFGWNDLLQEFYGVTLPEKVQQTMKDSGEITYTLGKVTFTIGGLYCNGQAATVSAHARLADGTHALLTGDFPTDAVGDNGENGERIAEVLGVDPGLSWIDAARQLNVPLYSVRASLEVPEELSDGVAMEDVLFAEDGSLTYFSMAMMNGKATGDAVACRLFLRVAEVDLTDSGNEAPSLTAWKDIAIPLTAPSAPLGTGSSMPSSPFPFPIE